LIFWGYLVLIVFSAPWTANVDSIRCMLLVQEWQRVLERIEQVKRRHNAEDAQVGYSHRI